MDFSSISLTQIFSVILVIAVFYAVYTYFSKYSSNTLTTIQPSTAAYTITKESLSVINRNSLVSNYTASIWFYIDSWDITSIPKGLFKVDDAIYVTLDSINNNLMVNMVMQSTEPAPAPSSDDLSTDGQSSLPNSIKSNLTFPYNSDPSKFASITLQPDDPAKPDPNGYYIFTVDVPLTSVAPVAQVYATCLVQVSSTDSSAAPSIGEYLNNKNVMKLLLYDHSQTITKDTIFNPSNYTGSPIPTITNVETTNMPVPEDSNYQRYVVKVWMYRSNPQPDPKTPPPPYYKSLIPFFLPTQSFLFVETFSDNRYMPIYYNLTSGIASRSGFSLMMSSSSSWFPSWFGGGKADLHKREKQKQEKKRITSSSGNQIAASNEHTIPSFSSVFWRKGQEGFEDSSSSSSDSTINSNIFVGQITNIPIQKWVHFAVCVNERNLDLYMNGKLNQTYIMPQLAASFQKDLQITAQPSFIGWTSRFQYFSTPLNPQQIWSIYKQGFSDYMNPLAFLDKYSIKLLVVDNTQTQTPIM